MYRRVIRFRVLAVVAAVAWCAGYAHAQLIEVRVADGNDDTEEHITENNTMDPGSSDLELGAEGGGTDLQVIGIRFRNVGIPVGSFIGRSFIQFTVDETDTEDTSVRIFGELDPDPLIYSSTAGDVTNRLKTTAFVDWNNIPLWSTIGAAGPDQRTPELAPIIEEIIGQNGWAAGNSMAFIIEPNPGGERTAESFNGVASSAALLHIEFAPCAIVAGDVTCDGVADVNDFNLILDNFLMSVTDRTGGDLNNDGLVDFADFRAWKIASTAVGAATSAVPEPSGLILAALTTLGLLGVCRRGRRV